MVVHQRRREKQNGAVHAPVAACDVQLQSAWDSHLPVPNLSTCPSCLILLTAAVMCFGNSYDGHFVFDDAEAIETNKDVTGEVSIADTFSHDFWGGKLKSNTSHKSYRPLTVLSFRMNHWLAGGLHPLGFHIVNIVLHGVVCMLLYRALCVVFTEGRIRPSKAAFCCSLLFAVHPVHTESVAGIVGRADLMCAITFLLSFLMYANACKTDTYSGLQSLSVSMLLCSVSVLFKEQGITVLASHRQLGSFTRRQLLLVLTGLVVLFVRWRVMGSAPPQFQIVDNPHSFHNSTVMRILNYNYLYALNCWLLLVPWWLCFDWSMGCVPVINSVTDPRLLTVLLFWSVSASLLFYCLFTQPTKYTRLVTMSLAFLVVPFLPASNLFFRVGFVVAERNLYLPSIGFCMLIVIGLIHLCKYHLCKKLVCVGLFTLLILFTMRSIHRSNDWRREDYLFHSGAAVCPLNAKVHYNVAKIYADKGNVSFAIEKYRHALRLNPDYDQALNNLANLLKDKDQNAEAEKLLLRAVEINPRFAAAWMNLGIAQTALGKTQQAEESYLTALKHRRKYPDCYYNLGNLYLELKRHKEALLAWRNSTLQKNTHANAWTNMIILLDDQGRLPDVETVAAEALRFLPDDAAIHYNFANALGKAGMFEKSEKHFLISLKLDPQNPTYHSNLGVLYHRWDKLDQAEKHYVQALKLKPDSALTRDNLEMLQRKRQS